MQCHLDLPVQSFHKAIRCGTVSSGSNTTSLKNIGKTGENGQLTPVSGSD